MAKPSRTYNTSSTARVLSHPICRSQGLEQEIRTHAFQRLLTTMSIPHSVDASIKMTKSARSGARVRKWKILGLTSLAFHHLRSLISAIEVKRLVLGLPMSKDNENLKRQGSQEWPRGYTKQIWTKVPCRVSTTSRGARAYIKRLIKAATRCKYLSCFSLGRQTIDTCRSQRKPM